MSADPPRDRLMQLLAPVVAAAGLDLEAVEVVPAGRRRLVRVVVDQDGGASLDDIAAVSRRADVVLDRTDVMGEAPYVLEVTSPGVDRPLTEPRHWRRAAGRLVRVPLVAAGDSRTVEGRVVMADEECVVLDIATDGGTERRRFRYAELGRGRVQVELRRDETDKG